MANRAFIAMGTNMPHDGVAGAALLARAVNALEASGFSVLARSGVWRTQAWPAGADQPDYFNAVIAIEAGAWGPEKMYAMLRDTELAFGRERRVRWAARTLDLDIVAIEGLTGTFGEIELPHAHMHERAFVLAPLSEVAPDWRHPGLGKGAAELLGDLGVVEGYRRIGDLDAGACEGDR